MRLEKRGSEYFKNDREIDKKLGKDSEVIREVTLM